MIATRTDVLATTEVEVEYEYDRGEPEIRYYPGRRGCCPNGDGHPGSPETVTLLHVWLIKDGRRLDIVDYLSDDDTKGIEEACREHATQEAEPA